MKLTVGAHAPARARAREKPGPAAACMILLENNDEKEPTLATSFSDG